MASISKTLTRIGAMIAIAGFGLLSLSASPAQASGTYDASGVELDFSNPFTVLENGRVGDSSRYKHVATIDGVVIDAKVSIVAMENSARDVNYLYVPTDRIPEIEASLGGTWTEGCYWTAAYEAANNDPNLPPVTLTPEDKLVNEIKAVDKVDSDTPKGINTSFNVCADYTSPKAAFVTLKIEFTTGVAATPVTLTGLKLSVLDIDGGQQATFQNPKPSSFKTYASTDLTVDDAADSTQFYGENLSVDAENQLKWAAEVTYDSASSLEYTFGFRESAGGGSLTVLFKGTNWDGKALAETGEGSNDFLLLVAVAALLMGLSLTIVGKRLQK